MSWFRTIALAASLAALTACGFRPLYGEPQQAAVRPDLSAVQIGIIPNRSGQILRNMLLDRITPRGAPANPRYRLGVGLTESRQELGIQKDETATRANLVLNATFTLIDLSSRTALLSGSVRSINSFDIVRSEYATLVAEKDARERGLRVISQNIVTRLAAYFTRVRAAGTAGARPGG